MFFLEVIGDSNDRTQDGGRDFIHLKYNPAVTVRKGQQITTINYCNKKNYGCQQTSIEK